MAVVRRGIMGGTFDPPHVGHLILASNARHDLELDEVWFIPAGDPYRKAESKVSTAENRLQMLEAALRDIDWACVRTTEIDRQGPTYTIDTILQLPQTEDQWWFILGSDALADMEFWKEPEMIVDAVRLAVGIRPGSAHQDVIAQLEIKIPRIKERIDYVRMPEIEISSSDLRDRIRTGRPTEFLLPEKVSRVIDELQLYAD